MHDWSFATKRKVIPELSDEDGFGWRKVFKLPSDTLRIISVKDYIPQQPDRRIARWVGAFPDHDPVEADFEVKDAKLYSDVNSAAVEYVSSNVDVSRFTPTFVVALSYFLAHQLVGARVKGKEGRRWRSLSINNFRLRYQLLRRRTLLSVRTEFILFRRGLKRGKHGDQEGSGWIFKR